MSEESAIRSLVNWFGRLIGWALGRGKIRFLCLAVLGIVLGLAGSYLLVLGGSLHGTDFAGFYTAGALLNDYPPERVYDLDLQDQLYHRLFPDLPAGRTLPYVYPPFFALLFRPLARLRFEWAYTGWLLLSVALFLGGLSLMKRVLKDLPGEDWPLVLLLSLSFQPLLLECWFTGQTTSFGFFALALALYCEGLGLPVCCGLSLALCLYKPPLLLLIVPMLLTARRWRVLAGFAAGAATLTGVSLLAVGWRGCLGYGRLLAGFTRLSSGGRSGFPAVKFVDLNHFFQLLPVSNPGLAWLPTLIVCALACPFLVRAWWAGGRPHGRGRLGWACTITCTLVLNFYVPIYDAALIILAAVLTADALHAQRTGPGPALTPAFKTLLVLLYVVPWFSQPLARASGVQFYTPILAWFGYYQGSLGKHRPGSYLPR
jgi:hypothetical protein